MIKEEFYWDLPSKQKIYVKCIKPEGDVVPKAIIGIVHGMGEHSNRYFNLEAYFIPKQYAVLAFDQIGHGKSDGKRGHVDQYASLLDNIDRLIDEAKKRFPNIPFVLYGHSMGGNLVSNYLLTRDCSYIKTAIISSPWLKLTFSPAVLTVSLVKWLNQYFPKFTQKTKLEINAISRDKDYVQNYYDDPLVHTQISLRFFTEIYKMGLWNIEHAHLLKTKTLWYHGDADRITSFEASKEFFTRCPNKELLNFHILPGYYHETHNDIGKEKVYELMEKHLKNVLNLDVLA